MTTRDRPLVGLGLLLLMLLGACSDRSAVTDAAVASDTAISSDTAVSSDADAQDANGDAALSEGWRTEPSLPFSVQELAYAMHDGALVIAGGIDARLTTRSDVLALDPGASAWRALPSLAEPRHHVSIVSAGGDLYAFGGMSSLAFDPRDDAWVLRRGASEWVPIAPMPEPRAAAYAGLVGDRVYIIGGQTTRGLASTVLVYDVSAGTWATGPAFSRAREHLAGFVDGTDVWLVGGRDFELETADGLVDVFDTVASTFRESPALLGPHAGHAAAIEGSTALVVGGELPSLVVDTIESRALDGTWSVLAHVPTPRHGLAAGILDGRIYVVGGAEMPTFGASDVVESFALP